jgi:hypothetical protein
MKYFSFILILFHFALFGQQVKYKETSRIIRGYNWVTMDQQAWTPWSELKQSEDTWTFFQVTSEIHWSPSSGQSYFLMQFKWTNAEETYTEQAFEGKRVVKFKCIPLDKGVSDRYGEFLNFWVIFHDSANIQLYIHNNNVEILSNITKVK